MVRTLALGLDPREYQLDACFLGDAGPWSAALGHAGVGVLAAPWSGPGDLRGALRFWRATRWRSVDLLHVHYGGRSVRAVARVATGAPVLVHVHGRVRSESDLRTAPIPLRDASMVIATSQAVAAVVDGNPVRVVYPGVRRAAAAQQRDSWTIGAAGRLVPIKGYALLIEALAEVRKHCPEARLEIAGDGPSRAELQRQVRTLRLESAVQFLGWCDEIEVPMSRWTVFAQPSLEEALGITVLQAMASGLPVIATAVGGIPEIVNEGGTGLLVGVGDVQSLARALTRLLTDRNLRARLGAAALVRADEFSEQRFVGAVQGIYRELLGSRAQPVR
jgi:glycosyltransferase involved in cell wall biosynthesis